MKKKSVEKEIKVGRLKLTIARKINKKCADIYLTPNYLKHIERRHKTDRGSPLRRNNLGRRNNNNE